MKINVKLVRKIKKHILAKPQRFYMEEAVMVGRPGAPVQEWNTTQTFPECGTTACIAGWACILSGDDPKNVARRTWKSIAKKAAALVGIDAGDADRLFREEYWPEQFSAAFSAADDESERAKIAAERLDHLIATKGAE